MGQKEDIIRQNFRKLALEDKFGDTGRNKAVQPVRQVFLDPNSASGVTAYQSSGAITFDQNYSREIRDFGVGLYVAEPVIFAGTYAVADEKIENKIYLRPGFNPIQFNYSVTIYYTYPFVSIANDSAIFQTGNHTIWVVRDVIDLLGGYHYRHGLNSYNTVFSRTNYQIGVTMSDTTACNFLIAPFNLPMGSEEKEVTFRPWILSTDVDASFCALISEVDLNETVDDVSNSTYWARKILGYVSWTTRVSHRAELFSIKIPEGKTLLITEVSRDGINSNPVIFIDYGV